MANMKIMTLTATLAIGASLAAVAPHQPRL